MNEKQYLAKSENEMNYMLFYPDSYEDLPLLVYLHGAGERGGELSHLTRHAIPKLVHEGREYPAVILCPQCPKEYVWDNVTAMLKALIDKIVNEFKIKRDRICITGSSMGGYGTWMMGLAYPNFFSAIGPIAGGGMSWRAKNLRNTPVYVAHGKLDTSVPITCSELMVNELKKHGGEVEFLVLENHGQNDGINYAYASTNLIEWLISKRRTEFTQIPDVCSEYF